MKSLKTLFRAAVVAAIAPNLGFAQTDGSTGGTTGGTIGGGGGIGSSSLSGNYGIGNTNAASTGTAITISPPSQVQTTNQMNASNIIGQYYANPMFQGRAGTAGSTATAITNPGGFATALYGNAGTGIAGGRGAGGGAAPSGIGGTGGFAGAAGNTGAAGRTGAGATTGMTAFGGATGAGGLTGTTGFGGTTGGRTAGAFGANTGLGGGLGGTGRLGNTGALGGFGGANQNNGLSSPRPIAYTATYKFPVAIVTPTQQQSDLRLMIDTSSQLASAKDVQVSAKAGGIVVLQGTVKDEDEARLVEGMMRITPGVRDVVNELKFPKTP
jgi:hypothetical protein